MTVLKVKSGNQSETFLSANQLDMHGLSCTKLQQSSDNRLCGSISLYAKSYMLGK